MRARLEQVIKNQILESKIKEIWVENKGSFETRIKEV